METRQQRLIRQALEHGDGESPDTGEAPAASLRDKSLEHTEPDYVPTTLTPFEWEEFYREHGVPPAHRRPERSGDGSRKPGLLRRLLGR